MPIRSRIPQARFNLKEWKDKADRNPTHIRMVYRYDRPDGGKVKVVYYPGYQIAPYHWDFERQRAKALKHHPDLSDLNDHLDLLSSIAKEVYVSSAGNITSEEFKAEIDRRLVDRMAVNVGHGLAEFFTAYIQRYELDPDKTEGTVKSIKRAAALIERYKADGGRFDFDLSIDEAIRFKAWLMEDRPGKKALEVNYAARMLGIIRQVLRAAYNEGKHSNRIYENTAAIGMKEIKKPKVALTADEVRLLYDLTPLEDEKRERVRVLFLAECYSGLRFSDVRRIRREHIREINGRRIIELSTTKTKTPVAIPCPDELITILERYDYHLPKLEQSEVNLFNRRLKEICRAAGLFRPVRDMSTAGGKVKDEFPLLYEIVSSHTGRRTWATLRRSEDFPIAKIQAVLGHASEKQTRQYIDMEHIDAAVDMAREMERIERNKRRREDGNDLKKAN